MIHSAFTSSNSLTANKYEAMRVYKFTANYAISKDVTASELVKNKMEAEKLQAFKCYPGKIFKKDTRFSTELLDFIRSRGYAEQVTSLVANVCISYEAYESAKENNQDEVAHCLLDLCAGLLSIYSILETQAFCFETYMSLSKQNSPQPSLIQYPCFGK